jgi:HTH-type transcriptional regulator/antitoxin HipB
MNPIGRRSSVTRVSLCGKFFVSRLAYKMKLYAVEYIDDLSAWAYNFFVADLARDPKQIGNSIRRARKKRALTQKELGNKAGLRQATISSIESGNPAAKIESLLAVLSALDLEFQIAPRSKGWGQDLMNF